ncbi:acyl-CoA N-acyltransferase [Laetiporus sulphureus 93-53]|uniref:histone acetyltransferase n=1 Tax=Laetiporus sulphureus 93-53 TaxID=1314785 RepID=A0A165FHL0_9APHY|nr:acyl-CoA N-acyltransferase [Laetiporus sulphureus 93-53]KZT08983.1 acyl-CoA N-acyltransferase [Laetiporus sulphureus 93-53]
MEKRKTDLELYIVSKNGVDQHAYVLERRGDEVYVHYVNSDKRLDEWLPQAAVRPAGSHEANMAGSATYRKRKRGSVDEETSASTRLSRSPAQSDVLAAGLAGTDTVEDPPITEEEYDIEHHKQITAKRNFDKVIFGRWEIKTWYFSPYPLTEAEAEDQVAVPTHHGPSSSIRIPGVGRSSIRSHGRTSDLFAGGLGRNTTTGEKAMLWVCDKCFKYMAEGLSWESHVKKCTRKHPPGRKVYQRGAHIIWEVDGAKEKLYCQNLSLFGKLFIDIKTLFFDCDNFMFYILTDADSQRDHVLGFFSKEKVSYDDYNLACIVVLPPYQKKGYGMLMIEFSYELSRRAGRIGTPERPLSDLGLRSYLTYWVSTLIRFFRRLLAVLPPDASKMITIGGMPDLAEAYMMSPSAEPEDWATSKLKRRKSTKGWDGEELPGTAHRPAEPYDGTDPMFTTLRTVETTPNADGSATAHVMLHCTLADIARATNLRVEDVAFALNECGLLLKRRKGEDAGDTEDIVVMSREMVETVAKERGVKKMCMSLAHVLL